MVRQLNIIFMAYIYNSHGPLVIPRFHDSSDRIIGGMT